MTLKHTKFDGLYRGAFFAALNMFLESIDRVKRFIVRTNAAKISLEPM